MTGEEMYNAIIMSALAVMLALTGVVFLACIFKGVDDLLKRFKSPAAAAVLIIGAIVGIRANDSNKPVQPPVVVERGISLVSVAETSTNVTFLWTAESTNIVIGTSIFKVESRMINALVPTQWYVLGTTTATNYVHQGFTVGQTFGYRISVNRGTGE